ncbi:GAF domain-containing protein [Leptolyngbya sp. PL-A3]|uniref:GAF domain-containing protein n=1 Tax=Leptolyngbya sp. PL-A3 TaxID=2933911 RepID=UPI003296DE36
MAKITLKRLIQRDLSALLNPVLQLADAPIGIYDQEGNWLSGARESEGERFPVEVQDEVLGWVSGSPAAKQVAQLLTALAIQAVERRSLATEALEKYREINLLYSIAEKLTSCREVDEVVKLALAEAHRLIRGSSAALFLLDAKTQTLKLISVSGQSDVVEPVLKPGRGITGYVAASKKPEIVNDVLADPRFEAKETGIRALLCAPMQAQEKVIGLISIYNDELGNYRAEELKLLTAIALQAAPALESALFLQQEMEAARKREAELQEKLQELRIEIDQAKRDRQVAEITESDFFQSLKKKAELMRKRVDSSKEPPSLI